MSRGPGFIPGEFDSVIPHAQALGINVLKKQARSFATMLKNPPVPRSWCVENWIPNRQVTLLYGDGGLGKSLLGLQLQAACALGQNWLGLPTTQCKSIGLYCEDEPDEIEYRLRGIAEAAGVAPDDPRFHDAQSNSRVGADNTLVTFETVTQYSEDVRGQSVRKPRWDVTQNWADLKHWAVDSDARLVILDCKDDLFPGNQNSPAETRFFVGQLRHIAMEIDGAVVLLAHPSVAGMSSGSGTSGTVQWNASVRSRLYLTKPKSDDDEEQDPGIRELQCKKLNQGPSGGKIRLTWDRRGVFKPEAAADTGFVATIEKNNREKTVIAAIKAATEKGHALSSTANQPNYIFKVFGALGLCRGLSRKDLNSTLIRLQDSGAITYGETGRKTAGKRPELSFRVVESAADA